MKTNSPDIRWSLVTVWHYFTQRLIYSPVYTALYTSVCFLHWYGHYTVRPVEGSAESQASTNIDRRPRSWCHCRVSGYLSGVKLVMKTMSYCCDSCKHRESDKTFSFHRFTVYHKLGKEWKSYGYLKSSYFKEIHKRKHNHVCKHHFSWTSHRSDTSWPIEDEDAPRLLLFSFSREGKRTTVLIFLDIRHNFWEPAQTFLNVAESPLHCFPDFLPVDSILPPQFAVVLLCVVRICNLSAQLRMKWAQGTDTRPRPSPSPCFAWSINEP